LSRSICSGIWTSKCFVRYNNRKPTDAERFNLIAQGVFGKRLTFDHLTGKTEAAQTA
jgi:hypothetical protein